MTLVVAAWAGEAAPASQPQTNHPNNPRVLAWHFRPRPLSGNLCATSVFMFSPVGVDVSI
jgi:hypothetical protein